MNNKGKKIPFLNIVNKFNNYDLFLLKIPKYL